MEICFENLNFGYTRKKQVLKNINLTLPPANSSLSSVPTVPARPPLPSRSIRSSRPNRAG